MMRYFLLLGCLAVVSLARAETTAPNSLGVLLPAISLTSDYRFNGMSLNDRNPALQGSLHLWRPDGYFAGLWISEVDFLDGETSLELDSYFGRTFKRDSYETKVELMYSAFNDDDVISPTYDFLQLTVGVRRTFDALTLGTELAWSPAGSAGTGRVNQLRALSEYRINQHIKTSTTLGRRWAQSGTHRSYWDAGVTFEWRKLDLDIRYAGTNLPRSKCFYTDWCEDGLYAKLTLASY